MRMKTFITIAAVAALAGPVFAASLTEEDVTPRSKKIYLEPQKTLIERGKLAVLGAVSVGFDNNTHLNSAREEDVYTQQFVRASFQTMLDEKTQGNVIYDVMNLAYADSTDLNLLRNTLYAGIDYGIDKDWIISPGYTFDSINYTGSGEDDWIEHGVGVKVKNRLPNKMYHSLGYSLSWRDFLNDHILINATTTSDKRRNDWRNTLDYEIGKYYEKDWVKGFAQYFYNDSNEKYLNYFDYDSYKLGGAVTHLFNDKVSGYLSAYWQKRFYRTRTVINDAGRKEHDSTYVAIASAYYSFTKQLTVGMNYTYRQNQSNEPSEEYSGSLVSASVYYRF